MKPSELRKGFYRLTRNVENPTPDKRKTRDWTAVATWQEGAVICAASYGDDNYLRLERVGHRYKHDCIGPGNREAYAALIEALEPVAEDYDCLMHRLGTSADILLDALHRMHRVSLADIVDANAFIDKEYDEKEKK